MIGVEWDHLEEMVALVDLYMRTKNSKGSKRDLLIHKLLISFRRRAEILHIPYDERYGNYNGLAIMLMNLRSIDTNGSSGLSSTSKLMSVVWEMYHKDQEKFQKILKAFNQKYGSSDDQLNISEKSNESEFTGSVESDPIKTEDTSELLIENVGQTPSNSTEKVETARPSQNIRLIYPEIRVYIQEKHLALDDSWAANYDLDSDQWISDAIEGLELSTHTINCLHKIEVHSICELLNLTVYQTATIRGMGKKSFCEIAEKLMALKSQGNSTPSIKVAKGEHLYFETNAELIKYREFILSENWSALDSAELSLSSKEQIERIKECYEVLGNDLLHDLLQSFAEALETLNNIQKILSLETAKREKIQNALALIPKERHSLLAESMIRAYRPSQPALQETLLGYFGGSTAHIIDIQNNIREIPQKDIFVLDFLKWCAFDLSVSLEKFMNPVKAKQRNMLILTLRSQNRTLQEVGDKCAVTRERVRQIESKIRRQFAMFEKQENLLLKISALRNGDSILTVAELKPYLGEHADCLFYLLSTTPSDQYTYNRRLHTFVIGCEEVASQVEHFIDRLPEQFKAEEFDGIVEHAEVEEGLPAELVRLQMNDVYSRAGTVYHRGRLTLTEMYRQTLRLHYPNGLHIYDENRLTEFKQHVLDEYGQEIKLPDNNRALSARLSDIGILCGRGMYRPKADSYIPDDLAYKIRQYIIDFESPILLTNTIFATFKNELMAVGVDNKYYLQGILGELYGEDFIFTRDYISKDANVTSFYSTIVECIKEYDYPVPKSLLMERFPGVPEIVMNLATADASVVNFFGEYMHRDRLRLGTAEKEILRNHLDEFLADGNTHTSRELFACLNNEIPQILRRNFIQFHFALFSVCECLFGEEAQFQRPYLAKNGVELIREEEILLKYLSDTKTTSVEELLDFTQRAHYRVDNILETLDSLNDEYLIVDQDSLVALDSSDITEEHCRAIEDQILAEIKDCTPIRSLVCLYTLPKISIKWTEWLIYSVLKKWSTRLEVSASYGQFRFAIPLVAPIGKMTSEAIEQIGMVTAQDERFDTFEVEEFEDLVADILLEEGDFDDFA